MSVLETPRLYFKGEVSWDPIVTNNYCQFYNENTGATVLGSPDLKGTQRFRANRAANVTAEGNWNPHGTHRVSFFNTEVHGFDLGDGTKVDDPFVSAAANLTGMLVDVEPFGSISSQIFFDSMHFGVDGGYRIYAPRTSRFVARYINFARNRKFGIIAGVASVIWQTSFAKADGLRIDSFDSPVLQKLAAAVAPDDVLGLTVRFNAYRTAYFGDPSLTRPASKAAFDALAAQLKDGGFQPNPARSLLVGVIGLWRKKEPAQEPGDRTLVAVAQGIASAFARCDSGGKLTIDLANTVPETGPDMTKQNLGTLKVLMVDPATNQPKPVATIPYDRYDASAYLASSGIVTVPLVDVTEDEIKGKDLRITDKDDNTLLQELPLRAIPRTPDLYLDQNGAAVAAFQVHNRGQAVGAGLAVNLYQMNADSSSTGIAPVALQTDADGVAQISVSTVQAGLTAYVPSLSSDDVPSGGINTQINTYQYVRVHPADADIAAVPPTFENVYSIVLSNWNAMAPCMDNWLDLSNPDQIKAYAAIVKRLTDPANFESYRFMPVTRDMTPGQRKLLYNFLDGSGEHTESVAPEEIVHDAPDFVALSRSLRRKG